MAATDQASTEARAPLSRERVLRAAVELADHGGIDALSMRKLGQELGVEAMSLYNHVSSKEDLLDGVVGLIVEQIDAAPADLDWKNAMRRQLMSARGVLAEHPWAPAVFESRTGITPTMMQYMDSIIGILLAGGLSVDLTHHALHVLGSRIFGFTQELYDESSGMDEDPAVAELMFRQMLAQYPNMSAMAAAIGHDGDDILGDGCDSDLEFSFALDLILDGLDRLNAPSSAVLPPPSTGVPPASASVPAD